MRGGLVEDDDPRRLQEQAGDGDALFLAAREAVAALADHSVEAVGSASMSGGDCARPERSRISASVAPGCANTRFARMVSWNRWASWVTTPMVSRMDANVVSRTSTPLMAARPIRGKPGGF